MVEADGAVAANDDEVDHCPASYVLAHWGCNGHDGEGCVEDTYSKGGDEDGDILGEVVAVHLCMVRDVHDDEEEEEGGGDCEGSGCGESLSLVCHLDSLPMVSFGLAWAEAQQQWGVVGVESWVQCGHCLMRMMT